MIYFRCLVKYMCILILLGNCVHLGIWIWNLKTKMCANLLLCTQIYCHKITKCMLYHIGNTCINLPEVTGKISLSNFMQYSCCEYVHVWFMNVGSQFCRQYQEKEQIFKKELSTLSTLLPTLHTHLVTCSAFTSSANKFEFLDLAYVRFLISSTSRLKF